jgi:hypothetical protein
VILACGGVYSNTDSFDAVGELAARFATNSAACSDLTPCSRKVFRHIVGFGGRRFLPHVALSFLMKLACKIFIEHFSVERVLPHILDEEESLGAHSTVFHFTHEVAKEWAWYHSTRQPQGSPISMQCPRCGCIDCLGVSYTGHATIVFCKRRTCGAVVRDIPRMEWKYTCENGMHVGSGWGVRTLWDERKIGLGGRNALSG